MPQEKKPINQNLTVPNALSVLRIIVIPFFAWFFMHDQLAIAVALLVRVTGLGENVDKVVEGLTIYETKTFAGMKSVTVANLIDRAGKKFAAEHNVDIRHVPVNDVCTLLGELDA